MVIDTNTILAALVFPAIAFVIKVIKPLIDWNSHSHTIKKDKAEFMMQYLVREDDRDAQKELAYGHEYGFPLIKKEIEFFEGMINTRSDMKLYVASHRVFEFDKYPVLNKSYKDGKINKEMRSQFIFSVISFLFFGVTFYISMASILIPELLGRFNDPDKINELIIFSFVFFICFMFFARSHSKLLNVKKLVERIEKHVATSSTSTLDDVEQIKISQTNT